MDPAFGHVHALIKEEGDLFTGDLFTLHFFFFSFFFNQLAEGGQHNLPSHTNPFQPEKKGTSMKEGGCWWCWWCWWRWNKKHQPRENREAGLPHPLFRGGRHSLVAAHQRPCRPLPERARFLPAAVPPSPARLTCRRMKLVEVVLPSDRFNRLLRVAVPRLPWRRAGATAATGRSGAGGRDNKATAIVIKRGGKANPTFQQAS